MRNIQPDLIYLDTEELRRISDQQVLDEYMAAKARERDETSDEVENLTLQKVIRIVREEVEKLPAMDHELVYLKFWNDMPNSEVADFLFIPVEEVEKRLESAFDILRGSILDAIRKHYRFEVEDVFRMMDR
jgi:DNA-directed RNA polymerase specialized sigma24 family protein